MNEFTITRHADGRVQGTLCALLIAAGFVLLLGPGAILLVAGFVWAGFLASRRTPGVVYALGTLAIVAVGLLAGWAIF